MLVLSMDVTSQIFWGFQVCFAEILYLWPFFVTVVDHWSWIQLDALQKYIVLPFLPCRMSIFQGCGGDSPHIPHLSYVPDSERDAAEGGLVNKRDRA